MAKLHRLTTHDNPFSPITQYDQWLVWDIDNDYHTNQLLARVVVTSPDLSPRDQEKAIEEGIDGIVKTFPFLYKKEELPSTPQADEVVQPEAA